MSSNLQTTPQNGIAVQSHARSRQKAAFGFVGKVVVLLSFYCQVSGDWSLAGAHRALDYSKRLHNAPRLKFDRGTHCPCSGARKGAV